MDNLSVIGQIAPIFFPEIGVEEVPARIDTGAQTSSIWASHIALVDDRLEVIFFAEGHPRYTGKKFYFGSFEEVVVRSSNGSKEQRYKIKLLACIGGKKIRARFTLADRSTQVYPVLVGRNILIGKFVVNVHKKDIDPDLLKITKQAE